MKKWQKRKWISEMEDPRNQSYITYTQADLVYMGIIKIYAVSIAWGRRKNFNEENYIATLQILSGNRSLEEIPHYDTLNYYLEKLSPENLSELRKKMVKSLIKGKQFNRNRLSGKYWRIILDGTGLFYLKKTLC